VFFNRARKKPLTPGTKWLHAVLVVFLVLCFGLQLSLMRLGWLDVAILVWVFTPGCLLFLGSRFFVQRGLSKREAWRAALGAWPTKASFSFLLLIIGTVATLFLWQKEGAVFFIPLVFALWGGASLALDRFGSHYEIEPGGKGGPCSRAVFRWSALEPFALGCFTVLLAASARSEFSDSRGVLVSGYMGGSLQVVVALWRGWSILWAWRAKRSSTLMTKMLVGFNGALGLFIISGSLYYALQPSPRSKQRSEGALAPATSLEQRR
jgi:hypothetical protein